jgi:hypothetical protein
MTRNPPAITIYTVSRAINVLLIVCLVTSPFASASDIYIPPAIREKLQTLNGLDTLTCGVAVTDEQREAGYKCMNDAAVRKVPFTFIWRKQERSAHVWMAWAGTNEGRVYEIIKGDPIWRIGDVPAVECTSFTVFFNRGKHGSAHCEHP